MAWGDPARLRSFSLDLRKGERSLFFWDLAAGDRSRLEFGSCLEVERRGASCLSCRESGERALRSRSDVAESREDLYFPSDRCSKGRRSLDRFRGGGEIVRRFLSGRSESLSVREGLRAISLLDFLLWRRSGDTLRDFRLLLEDGERWVMERFGLSEPRGSSNSLPLLRSRTASPESARGERGDLRLRPGLRSRDLSWC
jgi:hypothetical protein